MAGCLGGGGAGADKATSSKQVQGEKTSYSNGKTQGISTYRINTGMLFASFDGLRYTPESLFKLFDFVSKASIGEIIRKGDMIGQQSELKGYAKVILPANVVGAEKEIYLFNSNGKEQSVNFLETGLKSFTFQLPDNVEMPSEIEIECNISEVEDIGTDDLICKGRSKYKLVPLSDPTRVGNRTKAEPSPEENINALMEVMQYMGYEKLSSGDGYANIKDVAMQIYRNRDLFDTFGLDWGVRLNELIKGVSGIYLIGAGIEKVSGSESLKTPDKINKSQDTIIINNDGFRANKDGNFSIKEADLNNKNASQDNSTPPISPGAELYGQLYAMPDAKLVTMADLGVAQIIDHLGLSSLKDLKIPLLAGPAYPIFDSTSQQTYNSGLGFEGFMFNSFDRKNDKEKVLYFSNLWDQDHTFQGNMDVDDCLAKGDTFGFDELEPSSPLKPKMLGICEWDEGSGNSVIIYNRAEINSQELKAGEKLYEIEGSISVTHDDGAGTQFEPYGNISIFTNNIKSGVYIGSRDAIHVNNNSMFTVPFRIRVAAAEPPHIWLTGTVMESDNGTDDVIANLNSDWGVLSTGNFVEKRFKGDGHAIVKIKVSEVSNAK